MRKASLCALLACSALSGTAQAQSWTGAIDSDPTKAGNWAPATVPPGGATVIVDSLTNAPVIDGGPVIDWGRIDIGADAPGMLTVQGGARVNMGGALGVGGGQITGTAGNGRLVVTGAGTVVTTAAQIYVAPHANSTGVLEVSGGGTVRGQSMIVGTALGSTGAVSVTGATLDLGNGALYMGQVNDQVGNRSASLSITGGGTVIGGNSVSHGIGRGATLLVSGAGSNITVGTSLDLTGTARIENEGLLNYTTVSMGGAGRLAITTGGELRASAVGNAGGLTMRDTSRVDATGGRIAIGSGLGLFNDAVLNLTGTAFQSDSVRMLGNATLNIGAADGAAPGAAGTFQTRSVTLEQAGTKLVFNHDGRLDFAAAIHGPGTVLHRAGTTRLTNADPSGFSGLFDITGGTVVLDGLLATDQLRVSNGATLTGKGTSNRTVTVLDGILAPGDEGAVGTLTVGALSLSAGSVLNFQLGAPGAAAGVGSDLIRVSTPDGTGALTLDGTLNVTDAGQFGAGLYRLMDYRGSLTDNGLDIGATPAGSTAADLSLVTSTARQVSLLVGPAQRYTFWDGQGGAANALVDGGAGTWNATNTNWTGASGAANGAYDPAGLLIFAGTGGAVTVDDAAGAVTARGGMQFAVGGYAVSGDAIGFLNSEATIRVGDGTSAGAATTATIASSLTDLTRLIKTDLGTLALTGDSTVAGAVEVKAGTLRIEGGATIVSQLAGVATARDAATSHLLVTGTGTVLDVGTSIATSAFDQASTVEILDGGTLRDSVGGGHRFGLNSAVRVSGNGSLIDFASTAQFLGSLTVENDGVAQMATVDIFDGGALTLRNGGRIEQGDATGSWKIGQGAALLISGPATSVAINGTFDILAGNGDRAVASAVIEDGAVVRVVTATDSQLSFGVRRVLHLRSGASLTFEGGDGTGLLMNRGELLMENAQVFMHGNLTMGSVAGDNVLTLIDSHFSARAIGMTANGNNTINLGGTATGPAGGIGSFNTGSLGLALASDRLVMNHTGSFTLETDLSGFGTFLHLAGETRLTGYSEGFQGLTDLTSGSLRVDRNHGNSVSRMTVSGGATLSGQGVIGGAVSVTDGRIAPGGLPIGEGGGEQFARAALADPGDTIGLLTITGPLSLSAASTLAFQLGAPDGTSGLDSDLIDVGGDLVLDGTVDVIDVGGFGAGLYRLINYGGSLTDNGLAIGATPEGFAPSDLVIQTSTAQQVNLLVGTPVRSFNFWDGGATTANGAVDGGTGTWTADTGNWTLSDGANNGVYDPALLTIFAGTAGTVTVDNAAGQVFLGAGAQFAVGGYRVAGGALRLDAAETTLRVGDGTAAGAGITATIDSALTGTGGLSKTDLGTLVLTGANSYTGGTAVIGGTLRGTATSLTGPVAVGSAGTLQFDQAADGAYAGTLSGAGTLRKTGAGRLAITGASQAFAGQTLIEAGTLDVTGTLTGTGALLTVQAPATLAGNGTVAALDVSGRVSPGSGAATLTVAGDVTFRAGSIYAVDLAAGGSGDRIAASGRAVLQGGTVAVTTLDPETSYVDGTTWRILDAAGGLTGTFAGLTESSAFLDFALNHDATGASITVRQVRVFPDAALTYNQRQAASALKELVRPTGSDALAVYNTVLMLDADAARATFDASSGEIYASLIAARQRQGMALAGQFVLRGQAALAEGIGIWGGVTGHNGRISGDGNGARVKTDGIGGEMGVDWRAEGNAWAVGIGGGWQDGGVDLPARGSRVKVDEWHLGGYLRYGTAGAGFTALGAVAHARADADVTRAIGFAALSRTASSKTRVATTAFSLDLRYGLQDGAWAFGPALGLERGSSRLGAFRETGAGSLDLFAGRNRQGRTRYGLGGFAQLDGANGHVDLTARFVTGRRNVVDADLNMAGSAQPFNVRAPVTGRSAGELRASTSYDLGGGWTLAGQANILRGGGEREIGGNARLSFTF